MKITIAATGLAAAALCLLSTACSSSSSPKSASTSVGAAVHRSSSAGSTAPAATGGSGAGTCKQLTFADVQPLLIEKVVSVTTTPLTDGHGQQCSFVAKSTGATGSIIVQVLGGSQGPLAYSQGVGQEDKPVVVPGVGDKASRDTEDGEVTALKGDLFCSVSYSSSDDVPGVGPLEEAHGATNNIGEKYYDAVAKAMGTLCNRIYGSGDTTADLSMLIAAAKTAVPSDGGNLPTTFTIPTDGSTS